MDIDAVELELIAREVAVACGRLIVDERPDHVAVAATKSSAVDIVTEMDHRSEQLASQLLRDRRPADGQFGEEGLSITGTTGITWVVDPIDGTVNYLYGIPAYAVSVAAVTGDVSREGGWEPVAGAVYNPALEELFYARRGGGAHLDTKSGARELHASPATELGQTLLATGFSYDAERRVEQADALTRVIASVRDIRRLGSAALDLCHVAAGRVDAYYERGINPWDMAAGWIVATEAGLVVEGPDGGAPTKQLTIAGSAETVAQLRALLR